MRTILPLIGLAGIFFAAWTLIVLYVLPWLAAFADQ
jgi:hypothetical protein